MVSNNALLSDMVTLNPQYLRSVHLERDFFANTNFLITQGCLFTFNQLARGMKDPAYRAQSISGPYGTGKSAIALHFAKLLAKDGIDSNIFREQTKGYLDSVGNQLILPPDQGYIPILVTGSRESLSKCLLDGLNQSLRQFGKNKLLNKVMNGKYGGFDTKGIVQIFEKTAKLAVSLQNIEKLKGVEVG